MNAAKVADAVLRRLEDQSLLSGHTYRDRIIIRDSIIEEIGKEIVTEASVTNFYRHDCT